MINLYDKKCTNFNNLGIASLKDVSKCEVTEELNGEYTVSLEYPKNGKYANYIDDEAIIKCDTGDISKQLFRIKHIESDLSNIIASLGHISYDLADNCLEDVVPQDLNGAAALNWILTHTQYSHNFTSYSDITKTASARYVRKNPIESIIGDLDNSFVNIWRWRTNTR